MTIKYTGVGYNIEELTVDEIEAIYNAIMSSQLKDRRTLYNLKVGIEDNIINN